GLIAHLGLQIEPVRPFDKRLRKVIEVGSSFPYPGNKETVIPATFPLRTGAAYPEGQITPELQR
ncbi:MAG TPA: hypothetical protein VFT06_05240, partial [Flavisolibacter sp.]|nr:hypothetical protein [Flavisolibacter sp.]